MNLDGVISISGKPGLYKVVARSKNNIIVETLNDGKRIPAYSTDRISALDDISIYTYEDNTPLTEVYKAIFLKEDGKKAPSHKDSLKTLEAYLREVVPNYDEDRVYASDIKKLFQWYNILHDAGLITAKEEDKEETPASEEKGDQSTNMPKKKAPQKEKPKNTQKDNTKKEATKKSTTKKTGAKSSKKG